MFDYMIVGSVVLFFIIMVAYIYIKDNESSRKLLLYEKAIEELNKKIYMLEKNLSSKDEEKDEEDLKTYIHERLENDMEKFGNFVLSSQKELRTQMREEMERITKRVDRIEENIKNFSSISNVHQSNDKKIIDLYNKGLSISEIARNLRIGLGEVELVLKIAGIRSYNK